MADKKFSPMRYTASTEEAAINGALQIVGASRDEIEIEVLETTEKGVTVRIKPRSSDAPAPAPAAVEEATPAPVSEPLFERAPVEERVEEPVTEESVIEEPSEESLEEPSPIVEDVPELLVQSDEAEEEDSDTEIEAQIGDGYATSFADETPEFDDEVESGDEAGTEVEDDSEVEAEPIAVAAAPLVAQDPEVVERARNQAQEFLDRMGLEASAHPGTTTDAGSVALVIEGDDVGILIGKHGATLQSFQYLLNLTLNSHTEGEGTRVVVDAGNYRARRQSSLEQTARSAASKARRENRSIRLEPMPAHERRLVHMYLQTEADIATQSEGREPMRRIVVSPATSGGARPLASRPTRSERPFNNERSYGSEGRSSEGRGGESRSGNSGMGGYGRRGDANSERNRGYNRGR
jgi:spoIIIJ-associated protein